MQITGAQCRAARALLGISQTTLADIAGLNIATVVDFERHRRAVAPPSITLIALVLCKAGIVFLPDCSTHRDGVALGPDNTDH